MDSFKGNRSVRERIASLKQRFANFRFASLLERKHVMAPLRRVIDLWHHRRPALLKSVGALGAVTVLSVAGHHYVSQNMVQIYHVYVADQEIGTVKDPQVIEDFIIEKYKRLEQLYPNVHVKLNTEEIQSRVERAFMKDSNDQATLEKLDQLLVAKPLGVELKVDGQVVGIVNSKETANQILDQIKRKYVSAEKKDKGAVSILSAVDKPESEPEPEAGTSEVVSEQFMQEVELNTVEISMDQLADPQSIVHKLETGDVQPTIYTVEPGDCVSCIAQKFGVSKQLIYEKNPWIEDDRIKVGDQLDLTVFKPTLSVKTVEKVVENQEIQHEIIYEKDDTLRQGVTQTITPGKNGLKKVTFMVTKINGEPMEEELLSEEVVEQPVPEYAKKGTKVVLGEGTGKFIWPVSSPKITSSYGMRWGRMHKGIDLTGNRNIMAADNGEVIYAGNKNDGYGIQVIIDHKNGYQTVYAHLSKLYTAKGKIVEKGEKIGYMGTTGHSTGVHLHFEVHKSGTPQNPMKFLSK